MPIVEAEFRNINHKDVPAAVLAYVAALKDIVSIIPVPSGGYIFCFG